MNIRQRITLLIVLTFLALSFVGGFAVYQSRLSAKEVKTVTEGVVPSAIASVELMSQLKDVQIATLAMVSAPDSDSVNKTKSDLSLRKATLQAALATQYKQADSDAQRGLVKQAEESLVNYFSSIDDTAGFVLAGQKELAEATLSATVDQYLREQMSIIETVQIEKRRSKDEAIATMNTNLGNTSMMLTIVTLATVIFLTILGLLLYRQIVIPMNEMQSKMTDIATTQDYTHRVPVNRMDEIGHSLVAFNIMVEKIQQSSELVKQKSADIQAMLHYIPQGILTIVTGNKVHPEYSSYLELILETKDIGGRYLMDLVFSDTECGADILSQVETAIDACIGEDLMNFEFNEHLLVKEIHKQMPDGRVKTLELNWSPITDETGMTLRLMLSMWDVTELRALAAEASHQKRELAIIGEILAVNQEKFHAFVDGANHFIAENKALIESATAETAKDPAVINLLFRNMHTIKGNARTYGLLHITNLVHEAEQTYDNLRQNPDAQWDSELLLTQLASVSSTLQEYAHINEVKLGRKGPGRRGGVDKFLMVQKDHIQNALEMLERVDAGNASSLEDAVLRVRHSLQLIGTEKINDILAGVLDSLPSLAKELGKEPPNVLVQDKGIVVKNQITDVLKNVFMHLLRNSMDHGIEIANVRTAQGKSSAGRIELELSMDADVFQLRLQDDGRGLALGFIKKKAVDNKLIDPNLPISPFDVAQLIFKAGFSTAEQVSEISGRGVGMDAVKGFIEGIGGNITLHLLSDEANRDFLPFQTIITLPGNYAVKELA